MSDKRMTDIPLDHPKRSYPVLYSLESPQQIMQLQDSYRSNNYKEPPVSSEFADDHFASFEHVQVNQSVVINGFNKRNRKTRDLFNKFGSGNFEKTKYSQPSHKHHTSVFASQKKMNLFDGHQRHGTIEPGDTRNQELSNIMSEPNDNMFQRMVKNIKNAKQNENHSHSTQRTFRESMTITQKKSSSLRKRSDRHVKSSRNRVNIAPLTHRVIRMSNDFAPGDILTASQDIKTLFTDTIDNSKDTMFTQESFPVDEGKIPRPNKNIQILSKTIQTSAQTSKQIRLDQTTTQENHDQNPAIAMSNIVLSQTSTTKKEVLEGMHSCREGSQVKGDDLVVGSKGDSSQQFQEKNHLFGDGLKQSESVKALNGNKGKLFASTKQQSPLKGIWKQRDKQSSIYNSQIIDLNQVQKQLNSPALYNQNVRQSMNKILTPLSQDKNIMHTPTQLNGTNGDLIEKKIQIEFVEEVNAFNRSCYGLPSIAGPITGKQSQKTGGFTNTTIENNGISRRVTQFNTDENFKMVKQREKLNIEGFSDSLSLSNTTFTKNFRSIHQNSNKMLQTQMPNSPPVGSISVSQDFDKSFVPTQLPTFPHLKKNKLNKFNNDSQLVSDLEQIGLLGIVNKAQNSNNKFSSQFKNISNNFKTPNQKKLTVLVNAGNQNFPERFQKRKKGDQDQIEVERCSPEQLTNFEWNASQRNQQTLDKSVISGNRSIMDLKSNMDSRLSTTRLRSPKRSINKSNFNSQMSSALLNKDKSASQINPTIQNKLANKFRTDDRSGESIIPEEEEEPDEITGLMQSKYMFKEGFNNMVELLDRMKEKREANSVIKRNVIEISEELNIDIDQLNKDIHTYVNKRTLLEAAQQGFKSNPEDCIIMKKSMQFLKSESFRDTVIPDKPLQDQCNHKQTEEDNEEAFVFEYKRFLKFVHSLRQILITKQKFKKELLIEELINDKQILDNLTYEERQIFSNKEYARKILNNPLLNIVTTMEEINGLQKIQDLDNKRKHRPGVNSISSKGQIEITNATKSIIQRIAEDLLNSPYDSRISTSRKEFKMKRQPLKKTEIEQRVQQINEITGEFRINCIKQHQKDKIKNCMQRKRPQLDCSEEKMGEDDLEQRGHILWKIDETISEHMSKIMEIMKKEAIKMDKIDEDRMKSQKKSRGGTREEQGEGDSSEDQTLVKKATQNNIMRRMSKFNMSDIDQFKYAPAVKQESKMIFPELGSNKKFYEQAKKEIPNYNGEPNQESIFYKECEAAKLLAQPIYKFISNNHLRVMSTRLGGGYARPLAKYIQNMTQKNKHLQVIHIHLDDCGMSDEDCALLLDGCLTSQLGFALESLTIARNEVGPLTIRKICECLEMCDMVGTTKCLKSLCLSNLMIKNMNNLRVLFQKLEYYGDQLTVLRFQSMNLNDPEIIESICSNLRNNGTLHTLELSSCLLQVNQLMEIVDHLEGCCYLRVLDLSDNMVSDLKDESLVRQCLLLQKLGNYLVSPNASLYSLNLQGLFLGKKLLYLIEKIKQNSTLMQVNLTKNELTLEDEEQVMQILRSDADKSERCEEMFVQRPKESLLEKFDPDFVIKLNRFKIQHMKDDQRRKQKKVQNGRQELQQVEPEEQKEKNAQLMVNQIVNTGVMKELRMNKNIKMQLSQNARLGEVNVSTSLTRIDKDTLGGNQVDELLLRRAMGYNEFIFTEFGSNLLENIDFDKQHRWMSIKRSIQSSSWMHDILELQYLLVYIDIEQIHTEFQEVTDQDTIQMLMDQYGLQAYAENHDGLKRRANPDKEEYQRKDLNQPIIFGSFSDWRAFQMLRTYQFACIIAAQNNPEERQCLIDFVFDDHNCNLLQNFISIYGLVYPVISSASALHNAHVVGNIPLNPKQQKSPDRSTFIYSCLCPPGKHSLFVFVPERQTFYKKVIIVDPQFKQLINRKSILEAEATDSKMQDKKSKPLTSFQYFNETVNRRCNKISSCRPQDMMESMLIDMDPKCLPLQDLFAKDVDGPDKVPDVLKTLRKHYNSLMLIFKQMQSESKRTYKTDRHGDNVMKETYPLISFEYLRSFCEDNQICPIKKLDHTVKERRKLNAHLGEGIPVDSMFENMNRPRFLYFLAWLSVDVLKCSLESLIKKAMLPLLTKFCDDGETPIETRMKSISSLLTFENKGYIRQFCFKFAQFHGGVMNPRDLFAHVHGKAGVFIQEFPFVKFYGLSKKIVPYEALDAQRSYHLLDVDELIQFVFRINEHIYNPETYSEERADIPKHVSAMMDETPVVQFKTTMEAILNTAIKNGDAASKIQLNDEQQEMAPPVDDIEKFMHYLPDNCRPSMFAQVEKEYDHMVEVRRQVREKKLAKMAAQENHQ